MNGPAPATIRRRDRQARGASFERLRAQGIELLQHGARHTWTDHNLHDPGITILEQLCYALTELGYRASFPVADLLCAPDGRIHFEALALHLPHRAFSCHPTTPDDWVRALLDGVPDLDNARLQKHPGGPPGLWQLRLKPAPDATGPLEDIARRALAVFRARRPLGEDVDPTVVPTEDDRLSLRAEIELEGPHDAADVLAELFHRAAAHIADAVPMQSRRERLQQGLTLEQLHDGPEVRHGFAVLADDGRHGPSRVLHVADVQAIIESVPGVRRLREFALQRSGVDLRTSSIRPSQPNHALRLEVPGIDPAGSVEAIRVRRREQEIAVDAGAVARRVQELQAADRARRSRPDAQLAPDTHAGLPQGHHRPPAPYLSVQHHFPATYGLGRHGVPPDAGPARQAQSRQLQAYLALFDQVLANAQAQLAHLHELFRVARGGRKTYWWQRLDGQHVPGLDGLCIGDPATWEAEVLGVMDRGSARKHHLLDHLLALHGESLAQNAMRHYCAHLGTDELDELLLSNKAEWLADVVRLGRDRAGAFDDSRPLWPESGADAGAGSGDNTSGLARRVALLLGFLHRRARPLTQALTARGLSIDETLGPSMPASALNAAAQALVAPPSTPAPTTLAVPARLFRAGAGHDAYVLQTQAGARGEVAYRLAIGPGERDRQWTLGPYAAPDDARHAAGALRRALREANDACEGLHLLEHLLLRPVRVDSPGHAALGLRTDSDFFALGLTAVLPAWTVRTAQPGFRALASETLRLNAPAHLWIDMLWLDFAPMRQFEDAYGVWLKARRAWCGAPTGLPLATRLDAAAAQVLALLRRARAGGPETGDA